MEAHFSRFLLQVAFLGTGNPASWECDSRSQSKPPVGLPEDEGKRQAHSFFGNLLDSSPLPWAQKLRQHRQVKVIGPHHFPPHMT